MTTRCAFLVLDGVLDCSHNTFVPALCMAYNDIWSSPEFQNYPFGQRPVYIPVLIFFWGGGYDAVCVGDFRNFTLRQSVLLDAPVAPPPKLQTPVCPNATDTKTFRQHPAFRISGWCSEGRKLRAGCWEPKWPCRHYGWWWWWWW